MNVKIVLGTLAGGVSNCHAKLAVICMEKPVHRYRISLCTVCALLTCCLLFTILAVVILGIGIGYHYCFVTNSVEAMAKAAKSAGALRSGGAPVTPGHVMRSVDKAVKRGFAHRLARRETNGTELSNRNLNETHFYYQNTTLEAKRLRPPNITNTF